MAAGKSSEDKNYQNFSQATPQSCMPTIQWPALPEARAAQALALQYQLHQSQWWSAERHEQLQLAQIQKVIEHACQHNPFYQHHYKGIEVPQSVTMDTLRSLPIVTRQSIQEFEGGIKSTTYPSYHGKEFQITTSGSTGKPVEVSKTEIVGFMNQAFTLRDHSWHDRDLSAVFATIRLSPGEKFQAPEGFHQAQWGKSTAGIFDSGPSMRLDSTCKISEQLDWLLKYTPDYLMTYPSNLAALIECAKERGDIPRSIRQVMTFGELIPEYLRALLLDTWGIELTDVYSCQEAGALALQCPECEHYHVQCENVLLEVLNEDDLPCEPGETGRVVISSLHNYNSPLIRYEVGDYAEVGESCSCKRGLPVLNRIFGRGRNMVTYPDGSKAWPYLGGAGYYKEVAPIRQFQVIQTKPDTLEFHLVVTPELNDEQEGRFVKRLHETLRYPFIINFHYHNEIPRTKGGKYEDFISRIEKT